MSLTYRFNLPRLRTLAALFVAAAALVLAAGTARAGAGYTVNVRDAGAKGDGVTDDTAAIQSAIDGLKNGGTVFIPLGRYRVRGLSVRTDGVHIEGESMHGSVLVVDRGYGISVEPGARNTYDCSISRLTVRDDKDTADGGIKFDKGAFHSVRDVRVEGFDRPGNALVYLLDPSQVGFDNVVITGAHSADGLVIEARTLNTGVMSFNNVSFGPAGENQLRRGLVLRANGNIVDSLTFDGCFFHGRESAVRIEYVSGGVMDVSFTGCHIEVWDTDNTGDQACVEIDKAYAVTFSNCHFSGKDETKWGIRFKSVAGTSSGVVLENNEFFRLSSAGACYRFERGNGDIEDVVIGNIVKVFTEAADVSSAVGDGVYRYRDAGQPVTDIPPGIQTPSVKNGHLRVYNLPEDAEVTGLGEGREGQMTTLRLPFGTARPARLRHRPGALELAGGADALLGPGESITLYRAGRAWNELCRSAPSVSGGTVTLVSSPSTPVSDTRVGKGSTVFLFPANADAAKLVGSGRSPYVSGMEPGKGFVVFTADGGAAWGSEVFNYMILGE